MDIREYNCTYLEVLVSDLVRVAYVSKYILDVCVCVCVFSVTCVQHHPMCVLC